MTITEKVTGYIASTSLALIAFDTHFDFSVHSVAQLFNTHPLRMLMRIMFVPPFKPHYTKDVEKHQSERGTTRMDEKQ